MQHPLRAVVGQATLYHLQVSSIIQTVARGMKYLTLVTTPVTAVRGVIGEIKSEQHTPDV
jgi:hypothetical protein